MLFSAKINHDWLSAFSEPALDVYALASDRFTAVCIRLLFVATVQNHCEGQLNHLPFFSRNLIRVSERQGRKSHTSLNEVFT